MKLCLVEYYSDKYPKGHIFEIDDVMRSDDCASGVKLRVHMGKTPVWLDLGWFIPQNKTRSNKAFTRRKHVSSGENSCIYCGEKEK